MSIESRVARLESRCRIQSFVIWSLLGGAAIAVSCGAVAATSKRLGGMRAEYFEAIDPKGQQRAFLGFYGGQSVLSVKDGKGAIVRFSLSATGPSGLSVFGPSGGVDIDLTGPNLKLYDSQKQERVLFSLHGKETEAVMRSGDGKIIWRGE